jgi:hypothetical protein
MFRRLRPIRVGTMSFQLINRAAVTALILSTVTTGLAGSQAVVRGTLYDDATGAPIRGTVMLVDPSSDAAVVHVAADSLGQFSLQTRGGTYQIAAIREGYTSVLSAPIPLAEGERLTIKLPIAQSGEPQHRIGVVEHVRPDQVVQPRMSARSAMLQGFETRRRTGAGLHYDRLQLDKADVHTLGEFLQNVPGLRVTDPNATSSMNMSRNQVPTYSNTSNGIAACHVGWFIDGHRMDLPGRNDPVTDGLGTMPLDNIEAVEVFRGLSEMPAEFAEPDLRCGAVAVWTKRG